MPTYDYECSDCGFSNEVFQKFSEEALEACPDCHSNTYGIVVLQAPMAFVKGEPTTIQHLADRNTQKLGRYELQDKQKSDNIDKVKKDIEANERRSKINKMTTTQKKKYIEKGE